LEIDIASVDRGFGEFESVEGVDTLVLGCFEGGWGDLFLG
jgi:hypothetical protein